MDGIQVVAIAKGPAFAVGSAGQILAWNKAAERRLGYLSAEVVGRNCWRVLNCCDASSSVYCNRSCPVRTMVSRGGVVNRAQMFFGLIDRRQLFLRQASGETFRANTTSFMVQGETATREIVHVLE